MKRLREIVPLSSTALGAGALDHFKSADVGALFSFPVAPGRSVILSVVAASTAAGDISSLLNPPKFQDADITLHAEIAARLADGRARSANAAAEQLAEEERIAGWGDKANRASRLAKSFRKQFAPSSST